MRVYGFRTMAMVHTASNSFGEMYPYCSTLCAVRWLMYPCLLVPVHHSILSMARHNMRWTNIK